MRALPNLLTGFRLFAAPGLALVFAALDRPAADLAAFALFVLAAVTDFFDGWLARRLDATSDFGRMMDPIADKAMVITALCVLLMLTGPDAWALAPVAAILFREVLVSGLREFLAGRIVLPPTLLAKWKTTVQMTALAGLLLAGGLGDPYMSGEGAAAAGPLALASVALLWIAAAMTLVTGWDYLSRGLAALKRGETA